jgi:hypothetical protein
MNIGVLYAVWDTCAGFTQQHPYVQTDGGGGSDDGVGGDDGVVDVLVEASLAAFCALV